MSVEVKVCGITRPADARAALAAGADYLGLVFAESPRRVDREAAHRLVESAPDRDVGLDQPRREPQDVAVHLLCDLAGLGQVHGGPRRAGGVECLSGEEMGQALQGRQAAFAGSGHRRLMVSDSGAHLAGEERVPPDE